MHPLLIVISTRKIEVTNRNLPDPDHMLIVQALVVSTCSQSSHVLGHHVINVLLTALLLHYLMKHFFKEILLLLHHSLHLFLRLFLQSDSPFFDFLLNFSLKNCLPSLLLLFLYCLFLFEFLLLFFKFFFLVVGIAVCKRLPQLFRFLHKSQVALLHFPRRF